MVTDSNEDIGRIDLRVDLKPPISETFMKIKDERQFQTNAEAVRYCIIETANASEFKLEDVYWEKIRRYMDYEYLIADFNIFSVQNFINKALDTFFEMLEKERKSILSFDVRAKMNEEEREIALVFIELQEEKSTKQVRVEELAERLGMRNLSKLREILNGFVQKGILSHVVHRSEVFYHAKQIEY